MRTQNAEIYCLEAAYYRAGGQTIDIKFIIETNIPIEDFAESVARNLSENLNFQVEIETNFLFSYFAGIKASSGLRNSTILAGMRETVSIDAFLTVEREPSDDESYQFSFRAAVSVAVSRVASGDATSYRLPSVAEQGTYGRFFDDQFRRALSSICSDLKLVDDRQIVCVGKEDLQ